MKWNFWKKKEAKNDLRETVLNATLKILTDSGSKEFIASQMRRKDAIPILSLTEESAVSEALLRILMDTVARVVLIDIGGDNASTDQVPQTKSIA
jgi:hypothetical protein